MKSWQNENMHVIARPALLDAARQHPEAAQWLSDWWIAAGRAHWTQLADVRAMYPATDQVNCCLIFDVRGNTYRFICRVSWAVAWQQGTLLIKHFLTHAIYDRGRWRAECR
jgi:mRNA interferase HigB